jgi:hypothetical protein
MSMGEGRSHMTIQKTILGSEPLNECKGILMFSVSETARQRWLKEDERGIKTRQEPSGRQGGRLWKVVVLNPHSRSQ